MHGVMAWSLSEQVATTVGLDASPAVVTDAAGSRMSSERSASGGAGQQRGLQGFP